MAGSYWWETRVLRNLSMHPEGLSQLEIINNTGVEYDLVGGTLGYLAPNGYVKGEMELDGKRECSREGIIDAISSSLEDSDEKKTFSLIPYYKITEKGLQKLRGQNL